jgi:hypothetical protein
VDTALLCDVSHLAAALRKGALEGGQGHRPQVQVWMHIKLKSVLTGRCRTPRGRAPCIQPPHPTWKRSAHGVSGLNCRPEGPGTWPASCAVGRAAVKRFSARSNARVHHAFGPCRRLAGVLSMGEGRSGHAARGWRSEGAGDCAGRCAGRRLHCGPAAATRGRRAPREAAARRCPPRPGRAARSCLRGAAGAGGP